MSDHIWGDKDFNWDMLNDAMSHMITECHTKAQVHLSIKEKYGTIRYEQAFDITDGFNLGEPLVNVTTEQLIKVNQIVQDTAVKYPEVKEEILEDFEDFMI